MMNIEPSIYNNEGYGLPNYEEEVPPIPKDNDVVVLDQQLHLCRHCNGLQDSFSLWLSEEPTRRWNEASITHYSSPYAFEASANAGCTMCVQFVTGRNFKRIKDLQRAWSKWVTEFDINDLRPEVQVADLPNNSNDCFEVYWKFQNCSKADYWKLGVHGASQERYQLLELLTDKAKALVVIWSRSADTEVCHPSENVVSTRDSLPVVKRWLQECWSSHKICQTSRNSILPTRLLDLAGTRPKLCLTASLQDIPNYATLSHCWGKLKRPTLTMNTILSFQEEIPPDACSKTFTDAMIITKKMGIDYLWIDSLCIIQDSLEDWLKEGSLMASLYGGSAINIAAASAADGSHGCFFVRQKSWRCQFPVKNGGRMTFYDCVPVCPYAITADLPLETRGWTLQERILAPRTVQFTDKEVYWECYEKTACEVFPTGIPPELLEEQRRDILKKTPLSFGSWPWIVRQYSQRNLTFGKDKLVAISGIARTIGSGEDYVAGMWRTNLLIQLCWYREEKAQRLSGTEKAGRAPSVVAADEYRAPSWSWASRDFAIDYFPYESHWELDSDMKAEVEVQIDVKLANQDPFGQISSATLYVYTRQLFRTIVNDNLSNYHTSRLGCDFIFDDPSALQDPAVGQFTYVLPLLRFGSEDKTLGLLLEPSGRVQGEYRRIGGFLSKRGAFQDAIVDDTYDAEDDEYTSGDHSRHEISTEGRSITII